jgi:hypothetical protein
LVTDCPSLEKAQPKHTRHLSLFIKKSLALIKKIPKYIFFVDQGKSPTESGLLPWNTFLSLPLRYKVAISGDPANSNGEAAPEPRYAALPDISPPNTKSR